MELSIVIPCYNGYHLTELCLDSINNSILPADTEIILVDDGSTDSTYRIERKRDDITTVIRHKTNQGFPKSSNDGARIARGKHIAIFNNDIVVAKNWYSCIAKALELETYSYNEIDNPKLGMVSCCIMCPEPNYFGWWDASTYDTFQAEYMNVETAESYPLHVYCAGGPWVIKKEVFEDIGYLDEIFYPGQWEDIDFFLRMCINGWLFTCMQNCWIYHFGSQTMLKQFKKEGGRGWMYDTNRTRFNEKWGVPNPTHTIPGVHWEESLREGKAVIT